MNYIVDVTFNLLDEKFGSICQTALLRELRKRYKYGYYKHTENYHLVDTTLDKKVNAEVRTGYMSKEDINFITSKEFIESMLDEVRQAFEKYDIKESKDGTDNFKLPRNLELFKFTVNGEQINVSVEKSEILKSKEARLTDMFSFQ